MINFNWVNIYLNASDELSDGYEFLEDDGIYYEGSFITVKVNKYERNQEARRKCIEKYGTLKNRDLDK